MTDGNNFYYEVMSFGIKNIGPTYQRLMDYIFRGMLDRCWSLCRRNHGQIWLMLATYPRSLKLFETMVCDLTPKCVFGVEGGKFLGFMLTYRGIEANLEKCRTITKIWSLENIKEIQKMISRLATLSRFVLKLAEKTKPMSNFCKRHLNSTGRTSYFFI